MKVELTDASQIAGLIRSERKRQKITQVQLSQLSNVGIRFIRDLEAGKTSMHFAKVLNVLITLGITLELIPLDGDE